MDLIAGRFEEPAAPDGEIADRSPADLQVVLGVHPWAVAQVDRAVEAARAAQRSWGERPAGERVALVRAIGQALRRRDEELARAIALDVGKPLWAARTE